MGKCTHPSYHTCYESVRGGVNEYLVCSTCGHKELIDFYPSNK